uniref:hypothetical protein n=1 Tax=Fuscoporia viticola TaxID=139386 RepID=UPI0023AAA610|nr:hypothetical protein P1Q19_mgp06 [Fuscoporia viticola]WCF76853.1 hypothetical protein [Fuscoporia viticola]
MPFAVTLGDSDNYILTLTLSDSDYGYRSARSQKPIVLGTLSDNLQGQRAERTKQKNNRQLISIAKPNAIAERICSKVPNVTRSYVTQAPYLINDKTKILNDFIINKKLTPVYSYENLQLDATKKKFYKKLKI